MKGIGGGRFQRVEIHARGENVNSISPSRRAVAVGKLKRKLFALTEQIFPSMEARKEGRREGSQRHTMTVVRETLTDPL